MLPHKLGCDCRFCLLDKLNEAEQIIKENKMTVILKLNPPPIPQTNDVDIRAVRRHGAVQIQARGKCGWVTIISLYKNGRMHRLDIAGINPGFDLDTRGRVRDYGDED